MLKEHHKFQRFITSEDLPVIIGADGKKMCAWCEVKPLGKGRRRYCSEDCRQEFIIRSNGAWAAHYVYQRDKGVCALCGLDAERITQKASDFTRELWRIQEKRGDREDWQKRFEEFKAQYPKIYFSAHGPVSGHLWEADHILPVSEGGGSCGLENYRTLCRACHAVESGKLRKRLNAAKKLEVSA